MLFLLTGLVARAGAVEVFAETFEVADVDDVGLDAETVEQAFEIHRLRMNAAERAIGLRHQGEMVRGAAEQGGFIAEFLAVEPDVLARGANGEQP